MNKRGMTLMELLVYMALIGIVVIIAGQAFSDSTKMKIRTESMMNANQAAENIGSLLKDDVGQMGAKRSKENLTYTSDNFYTATAVYMNSASSDPAETDYSSFFLRPQSHDSLYFLRERYSDNGTFEAVEEVSWFLEDGELWRSCKTKEKASSAAESSDCPSNSARAVLIAEQVSKFLVTPAKPGLLESATNKILYPPSTNKDVFRLVPRFGGGKYYRCAVSPVEGGSFVTITNIASNYEESGAEVSNHKINELYAAEQNGGEGEWSDLCAKMTFEPTVRYIVSFSMNRSSETDASQSFVPGKDLLSVGLRSSEGTSVGLSDFLFYPPSSVESNSIERIFEFSVPQKIENACLVITVAAYTPRFSAGSLNIGNLKVSQISDENYEFEESYEPDIADKKNVKAFKIELQLKQNNEAGNLDLVIPVPSNGADYE